MSEPQAPYAATLKQEEPSEVLAKLRIEAGFC
jgi:hypothetical protein